MADVQDEEQWLYGDDKGEPLVVVKEDINKANEENSNLEVPISSIKPDPELNNAEATNEIPGPVAADEVEDPDQIANEEEGEDNSSDDDDEPTVTIGKIVKQPDILRAPPPTHRAAPTSGLKDDDFNSAGKINGVPVAEFNTAELEDKPWRKPGADLSDYFNYGFNEESWIKYCERQKAMRVHESCVGLSSLGINTNKPEFGMTIIPSGPFVPENSKYGGASRVVVGAPPPEEFADDNGVSNIQVMTADRRIYSNKYMANNNPHDMDFGVPFGADFNVPPPSFYNPPPPHWVPPPGLAPPHWRQPPMGIPPPIAPPDMGSFYDGDSSKPREFRSRSRDREVDSRERDRMSPRERRHRRRSRSRSTSRPRHRRRSRSKSRSRSPSSKHKRKKSKRDRDD